MSNSSVKISIAIFYMKPKGDFWYQNRTYNSAMYGFKMTANNSKCSYILTN